MYYRRLPDDRLWVLVHKKTDDKEQERTVKRFAALDLQRGCRLLVANRARQTTQALQLPGQFLAGADSAVIPGPYVDPTRPVIAGLDG